MCNNVKKNLDSMLLFIIIRLSTSVAVMHKDKPINIIRQQTLMKFENKPGNMMKSGKNSS